MCSIRQSRLTSFAVPVESPAMRKLILRDHSGVAEASQFLKIGTDSYLSGGRPEGFVGDGLDGIEAAGQKLLGFGLVCVLGEEPLALAGAPDFGELVFADVDAGASG